jgi:AsmA family protein
MKRRRLWLWIAAVPLGLIAVLAVAYFAFWDWNYLRGYASERASGAAGRKIEIGDIDVQLGRVTRVVISNFNIANADWAKTGSLAKLDKADVTIRLLPLLRGRVVLPNVHLVRPEIALEKTTDGKSNWDFSQNPGGVAAAETAAPDKRSEFPIIGALQIDDGKVHYVDHAAQISIDLDLSTAVGTGGGEDTVKLDGVGRLAGDPFHLRFVGGSLLSLREESSPYPVSIAVDVGETKIAAEGTVQDPLQLKGFAAQLKLSGPSLSKLFPVLGVALPPTPAYTVEGRLSRDDRIWQFTKFSGRVGGSDLRGDLKFNSGDRDKIRPRLEGQIAATRLNFADLGGVVGHGDEAKQDPNRALPNTTIDLERLRAMDADVRFEAKSIVGTGLPVDNLATHIVLANGVATLNPLRFGIAYGELNGSLKLDGSKNVPYVEAKTELRRISLNRLMPESLGKESVGEFAGNIDLRGTGRSTAELLGGADGRVTLFMAGGQLNLVLAEIAGLDIGETLGLLLGEKQKTVPIRCAVADFDVTQGVMPVKTLIFDTTDTNISGSGSVSLRDEGIDLVIRPHPKDISLFSVRAPILVQGSFKKPRALPDPGTLAARIGAATALGIVLTPLAALIPLIEGGLGKDSDCHTLMTQVTQAR